MLGKTGTGKSSVGNTIFGETLFKIGETVNSEAREYRAETRSVNGRSITFIDTPGLFDTERPEEEMKREILRCITECAPGPHAFLIVLKVEKFTKHEQAVFTEINQYFSEEFFKYAAVVFTHGDQLSTRQTIEDFVRDNPILSDLIEKCGGRVHVIDNKYWNHSQQHEYRNNQFQVEELLQTIDTITEVNEGSCYTNEMLQAMWRKIQQEEERIRESSGNMSENVRQQANDIVSNRLWINLAGITVGAVAGAFLGAAVMVKVIVPAITEAESVTASIAPAKGIGAAAGGGIGAAAGGGIGAGILVAAGSSLIGVTVVSAVVGAVAGGVIGYYAVEEADTPSDAAVKAEKAVKKE